MKKLIFLFFLVFILAGCEGNSSGAKTSAGKPDVEISDMFFKEQVTQIYMEPERFLGKSIRYSGVFMSQREYGLYAVGQVFGCCVDDYESIGFVVELGDREPFEDDASVQVTGALEEDADGMLFINVTNIQKK